MYAFVSIFLLYSSLWLRIVNGLYEEFCEEKKAFDPYVKIYGSAKSSVGGSDIDDWGIQLNEGREGPDPLAIDTRNLKDIFVCLNGPAWLYFEIKKDKKAGTVYDDARFDVYEHKCQLFNGAPGPGNTTERKTLVAILLLGKNSDYRLPYLQLFTAPLFNEVTGKYQNVTSFMTIGTETCVIKRGKGGSSLHIQPIDKNKEFNGNMFCNLSYTNVKEIDGFDETVVNKTQNFLKHDVDLKNEQCGNRIANSKYRITDPDFDPKDLKTYVSGKKPDTKALQERFDPIGGNQIVDEIVKSSPAPSIKDKQDKVKDAQDAFDKETDNIKKDSLKVELDNAIIDLTLEPYKVEILELYKEAEPLITGQSGASTIDKQYQEIIDEDDCEAKPDEGLCKALKDYQLERKTLKEKEAEEKKSARELKGSLRPTKDQIQKLSEAKRKTKEAQGKATEALNQLNQKIEEFEIKYSGIVASVDRANTLCVALKDALKRLEQAKLKPGMPYVGPNYPLPSEYIPIQNPAPQTPPTPPKGRQARDMKQAVKVTSATAKERKAALRRRFTRYLDRATSINPDAVSRRPINSQSVVHQDQPRTKRQNANDPPIKLQSCKGFKTPQDLCLDKKPGVVRACHLLKAIQGRPETCALRENETAAGVIPKIDDLMGNTTNVILDLIKDIFSTACTPIKKADEFARRINDITKCYFVKPQDDGGAELKNNKVDENAKKARSDKKFWSHVLEALTICRDKKMALSFKEKPLGSGNFVFQKGDGKGGWTEEPVHHFIEQADREYVFNFVLEMHFRMFATVMGLCMPSYEQKIPLITTTFYTMYTDAYFKPLINTWIDSNDNQVFKFILGNYINGKTQFWATECMEASFIQSGDVSYRPPRDLYVNGGSEKNFFISGIYKHTTGRYTLKKDCK